MPDPTTDTKSRVALLVHSCDRYEFLFKGFEYFFNDHWDFNIDCNHYFATEEKEVSIKGFKNIRSGKGEWADRLRYLLDNEIPEDYILYFQEDMWLNKKVNANFFNQLFESAVNNKWKHVKLHSSSVYTTEQGNQFIDGFNIATVDNPNSDFLMSHQVTLWEKQYLIDQLHKGEHPWRNERKGTKRLRKLNPEIFHIDYFAENGNQEINKNNNPLFRSAYNTISLNGVLTPDVEYYIQKLEAGNSEQKEYASKLRYNYQNHLTHDGKEKPRKVDFFKRMKNMLTNKKWTAVVKLLFVKRPPETAGKW